MPDVELKLYSLLIDVILPNLNRIQASQAEQRTQGELLNQNLEKFRAEMRTRFSKLHAELAATKAQVELAIQTLQESESARTAAALGRSKNSIIH